MPEEVEKLQAKFDKLWAKVGRGSWRHAAVASSWRSAACCAGAFVMLNSPATVHAGPQTHFRINTPAPLQPAGCPQRQLQVLARSDGELGRVTAADREAVQVALQALREQIEEYCLID